MRELPVSKRVYVVTVVIAQILVLGRPSFAQNAGSTITAVVKQGDPVSDGGRFFDCGDCEGRVIGLHAFNNRGDVAIAAEVVSGTCFTNRFLISAGQSIRLADSVKPQNSGS